MEEAVPGELNLFSKPPTLLTVSEYQYEQFSTKTNLRTFPSQLEFDCPADKVQYTSLKDSFLMIQGRFVKGDGTDVEADSKVGPVNQLATSVIKAVNMAINDNRVTPTEQNAAYIHYVEAMLQPEAAKKSWMTAGMYYEDTMTNDITMNQADPQKVDAAPPADPEANKGLAARTKFFNGSTIVTMIAKLKIPPHLTHKLYLPHLKFSYILELHQPDFFSMTNEAATAYTFRIMDAKMLLKRVTVSPALALAHEHLLQKQNALYDMKYVSTRTTNIPQAIYSHYWENVFVGNEMPTAIVVAFVDAAGYNGNFKENPFFFRNVDLAKLTVHLGSKKVPNIDVKNKITSHDSALSFWQTMKTLGFFSSENGAGAIDRSTFERAAFLLAVDLSRDGNPSAMYMNSSFSAGNLSLQFDFTSVPTATYTGKVKTV